MRDEGLKRSTPCRPWSSPSATVVLRPHPSPSYRLARPGLDRQYAFARRLRRSGPQNFGGAPIVRWGHADIGREEVGKSALGREAEIGLDRQYAFARRLRRSGPQNFGGAPIVRWGHADIGREEVGKSALGREAEIETNVGDRRFRSHQRVQRFFHRQCVDIEVRRDAGLGAEKLVEMRSRQAGLARNRIELDLGAHTFRQQLDRLAYAKVGYCGASTTVRRGLRLTPAFFVASVDQTPQFPVETFERWSAANHCRRVPDGLVQGRGAFEFGAAETQATNVREPLGVYIEDEEERPVCQIVRQEIVRFPGIDRDDGIFAEQVGLLEHFHAARRAANMENQVPFAMRVYIEGTIELIDRRAAEMAVKDGKSPAHAFLPRIVS